MEEIGARPNSICKFKTNTDSVPTIWYAIDICVTVESILLVKNKM